MRGCGNKSPYPRGSEIVHPGGVGIRWTGNVGQVMRSKKKTDKKGNGMEETEEAITTKKATQTPGMGCSVFD